MYDKGGRPVLSVLYDSMAVFRWPSLPAETWLQLNSISSVVRKLLQVSLASQQEIGALRYILGFQEQGRVDMGGGEILPLSACATHGVVSCLKA